jgi:hypothetical protein
MDLATQRSALLQRNAQQKWIEKNKKPRSIKPTNYEKDFLHYCLRLDYNVRYIFLHRRDN